MTNFGYWRSLRKQNLIVKWFIFLKKVCKLKVLHARKSAN